jgi:AraC-like DNA-binding protein
MNNLSLKQFSTNDPDEMAAGVSVTAPGMRIGTRAAGRFSAKIDAVQLDNNLAMQRIRTKNIRVRGEPTRTYTSLTIPLTGGFEIDRDRRCNLFGPNSAHVQHGDRPFDLASAETAVLVVNIDDSTVESTASNLACKNHETSPKVRSRISLSGPSGVRLWRDACSLWSRVVHEDSSPAYRLEIVEREKEIAADIALAAGIVDEGPEPSLIEQRRSRARLNQVEEWILANLDMPISRDKLCAVSGLQVRALSRYFAHTYGKSPMRFVRDRRLDAIYRVLLAADPAEVTVTHTAVDFGCYHLGRFAADYRAAFGESPIDTLRN